MIFVNADIELENEYWASFLIVNSVSSQGDNSSIDRLRKELLHNHEN